MHAGITAILVLSLFAYRNMVADGHAPSVKMFLKYYLNIIGFWGRPPKA